MTLKSWIQAARLRTLPLSVSGIIVGSGLANYSICEDTPSGLLPHFAPCNSDYLIFILCLLTTIAFQVLSNFANDYGDGIKGTDANRKGEKRLVASGEISPQAMKRGMIITTIIALILALLTLYEAFGTKYLLYFITFLGLGIASIAAAIKYTVGDNAYGYTGYGDVFVFLFFGLLSTVGSYFLYTKSINGMVFLPAIAVGALSVAVLNLNNMRDREDDIKAGKHTLAVKLGAKSAKTYHYVLIAIALATAVSYVVYNYQNLTQFMFLIAFVPLLIHLKVVEKNKNLTKLDGELKKVALSTFLFAILFSIFI